MGDWRHGSAVTSESWSCREPEFGSPKPQWVAYTTWNSSSRGIKHLQPSRAPVLTCTYPPTNKYTHTHIIKKTIKLYFIRHVGWRDGSTSRGPGWVHFPAPAWLLTTPLTPVPGEPTPSGQFRQQVCTQCTDMHTEKTLRNKNETN